jgi:hypothetical protein
MTQVIVCSAQEGIILATDSRATWYDQTGAMRHFSLKKLVQLSSHSALVSAGAGVGAEMALDFQEFVKGKRLERIEEIARYAAPFFTDRYGEYSKKIGDDRSLSGTALRGSEEKAFLSDHFYFIVAGYSFKDRHHPYFVHLLGSEEGTTSIRTIPTTHTILIPRSISMETRLEAQCLERAPLRQILSLCHSFLKKRSDEGEEVGSPFYFATITPVGFKEITDAG